MRRRSDRAKGQVVNLILTIIFGIVFLVVKYFEYAEKFEHHLVPGPHFDMSAAAGQPAAALLLALLHDDRHPRPAHGRRHRPDARDSGDGVARQVLGRATTRRSKCRASTGTSSTSSGSSCSRSCTCWERTGARTEASACRANTSSFRFAPTSRLRLAARPHGRRPYLVATQDFGWLNTPIALAVAVVKASLVVIYFMGVRYNTPLTKVVAVAGFFWLFILFGLDDERLPDAAVARSAGTVMRRRLMIESTIRHRDRQRPAAALARRRSRSPLHRSSRRHSPIARSRRS